MKQYLGFIAFLVIFSGCQKSVEPLGALTMVDRSIEGEFDAVYVEGTTNVRYSPADSVRVMTEAYPGDHQNIITQVVGSSLIIEDKEGAYPDIYRRVHLESLPPRRFLYAGSGDVELVSFPFQNLAYQIAGSGDVSITGIGNSFEGVFSGAGQLTMTGEGAVLSVNHQGPGTVDARDLIVESCKVEVNGPGDTYIHVISNMTIIFNGTGDVYYTGPVTQIVAIYNGSGELIRLPE